MEVQQRMETTPAEPDLAHPLPVYQHAPDIQVELDNIRKEQNGHPDKAEKANKLTLQKGNVYDMLSIVSYPHFETGPN